MWLGGSHHRQPSETILIATSLMCSPELSTSFIKRVGRLCSKLRGGRLKLRLLINCFMGDISEVAHTESLGKLRNCDSVEWSAVTGMKGLFWKLGVSVHPSVTFVWLADADLAVDVFDLEQAIWELKRANVGIAQPRCASASVVSDVKATKKERSMWHKSMKVQHGVSDVAIWQGVLPGTRSTDIEMLRASKPLSTGCYAARVPYVEVMTPIFAVAAWRYVHTRLLSVIPDHFLRQTTWGLANVWCMLLDNHTEPSWTTGCAVLNTTIMHLDTRMIDLLGHNNTYLTRQGGNLVPWLQRHFVGTYFRTLLPCSWFCERQQCLWPMEHRTG